MKAIPPIFVISLKHSQRRHAIAQRLNGLGLSFEFFDGVYGKTLSEQELAQIDYHYLEEFDKRRMTAGEIGCAISHIRLYEYIRAQNIAEAIILEDDAVLSTSFKRIMADLANILPSRYEILFFEHGKAKSYPFIKRTLYEGYRLVRYRYPSKNSRRGIMQATAYMVNLAGIEKLLAHAYPIRMPADFLTGFIQQTGIHAYGIEPPCVFRGADSEIDEIESRRAGESQNGN